MSTPIAPVAKGGASKRRDREQSQGTTTTMSSLSGTSSGDSGSSSPTAAAGSGGSIVLSPARERRSLVPLKKRGRPVKEVVGDTQQQQGGSGVGGGLVGTNAKPKRARRSAAAVEAAAVCADVARAVSTTGTSTTTSNTRSGGSTSSSTSSDSRVRYLQSVQPAAAAAQPQPPQPPPSAALAAAMSQNPALGALLVANPALAAAALAGAQQLLTAQQPQPQPQPQQQSPQQQSPQQALFAAALASLAGLGATQAAQVTPASALSQQLSALLAPMLQSAAAQQAAAQQAAAQTTLAAALQKIATQSATSIVSLQKQHHQHQPVAPKPQPVSLAPALTAGAAAQATTTARPTSVVAPLPPASLHTSRDAKQAHEVAAKALQHVQRSSTKKRGCGALSADSTATGIKPSASKRKKAATKAANKATSASRGRKRATALTPSVAAVAPKRTHHQPLVPSSSVAGAAAAAASSSAAGPGHLHHHVHQRAIPPPRAAGEAAAAATPLLIPYMRKWKLEELEAHVKLLTDANQPVPQALALLLAEARRKEEKRNNKRAANRRSASTSRARKKALVEEMTKMNARLRRQALILSLLPDMVLAINVDGVITFGSAQVERILQHNSDHLIGAKLSDILLPPSRDALRRLVNKLVASEAEASGAANAAEDGDDEANFAEEEESAREDGANDARPGRRGQENGGGENDGDAVVVSEQSEQSFPLSVVNVKNRTKQAAANVEDVSVSSGGENAAAANKDKDNSNDSKGGTTSSLTNNSALSRSTTNSSFGNDSKDAADGGDATKSERESVSTDRAVKSDHRHGSNSGHKDPAASTKKEAPQQQPPQQSTSGDDSSSTSNLRKASEALNRNVRWHNEKMLTSGKVESPLCLGLTDDVTGASVTANNAGARLSSLQHLPSMIAEMSNNMPNNTDKAGTASAAPVEEGERLKKVTGKAKKPLVGRKSSTLTFESLEDAQSSSSDSLLSGVEEKGGRARRAAPRGRNGEMSSEDSGYRESGESVPSREDTSSSASDDASTDEKEDGSRPKPLAPTCNVCVIRKDLSTVWCEVTSSIRTRTVGDEEEIEGTVSAGTKTSGSESKSGDDQEKSSNEVHELLLCFRPIRDGEEKVGEELRFVPPKKDEAEEEDQEQASADRSNTGSRSTEGISSLSQSADRSNTTGDNSASAEDATNTSGLSADKAEAATRDPPEKRALANEGVVSAGSKSTSAGDESTEEPPQKKRRSLSPQDASQCEADVAESLVLMNRSPQ